MLGSRLIASVTAVALLALTGCDPEAELLSLAARLAGKGPGLVRASAGPGALESKPARTDLERSLEQRVRYRRFQLAERLGTGLGPVRFREQPCPDASIAKLGPAARHLLLGTEDARFEPKHLIPLALLETLLGAELRYSPSALRYGTERDLPATASAAREELDALDALAQRRYRGVYHITQYSSPKLITRKGSTRPEWLPGVLVSWLVIHDLEAQRPVCQTQIVVTNDIAREPLHRSTKSAVRERLIQKLGSDMRQESARALLRITRALELPEFSSAPAEELARRANPD